MNTPLIIDSFAGGGGASTGIEMALGRSPDIAINHDPDALAMHEVNHPQTLHVSQNVYHVDPLDYLRGKHVGLAWFSPDCKHFSKAKGGTPVQRNIRDLAWIIPGWVERIQKSGGRVDVVILENVEEFQTWGPLIEGDRGLRPCPERRGETFEKWKKKLRRLGGKIELRELRGCDYGAPTIRKRLFIIIRFDGRPIVWPKPTHGRRDDPDVIAGKKLAWRTAAEIIDWSLPCPSIFETSEEIFAKFGVRAVRPLADATMKRIARGVVRYVLEAKKPFVVSFAQQGGGNRSPDDPLHTITASPKDQNFIIIPSFIGCGGRAGQSAPRGGGEPLGTQTAKADGCLVTPILVETAHGEVSPGGVKRWGTGIKPTNEPLGTATISGNRAIAAVHLSRFTQNGIGQEATEPLDTVMAGATKFAVVAAFLAQHNNDSRRIGGVNPGQPVDKPLATLTATGLQQAVVAAHMMRQFGTSVGHDLDEPTHTDTATVNKSALISGFLTKYYGTGDGAKLGNPMHTDTTKDRFGLVTVDIDGATYAIADIGMRMLTPRERFRAQGFPDDYIIDRRADGSAITAKVQGRCCGNSVCPPVAEALVSANCGYLARVQEAAE